MKVHAKFFVILPTAAIVFMGNVVGAQTNAERFASQSLLQSQQALVDSNLARDTKQKTSIGSAFLRSALIPGWGQRASGANTAARNFFVTEVGLWLGVIAFNRHGAWLQEDYRLLAAEHAEVDSRDKSDAYYVEVGNYMSIEEYNQSRLQRRDIAALYDPAIYYWQWDTEANRNRFADLRLRSDKAFSRSQLFVAAILGNHIISGIHAAWRARRHSASEKSSLHNASPQLGVVSFGTEIRLTAQVKF